MASAHPKSKQFPPQVANDQDVEVLVGVPLLHTYARIFYRPNLSGRIVVLSVCVDGKRTVFYLSIVFVISSEVHLCTRFNCRRGALGSKGFEWPLVVA